MKIKIKLIEGGKLPEFKTDGAVCADCYARIGTEYINIPANSRCLVNLGFALELPKGCEALIRPRSGLSRLGVDVALGTIDFDYRGEIKACIINNTIGAIAINNGERICQIAIREVPDVRLEVVDELSETERGENGFGSTGK
jgi:dUTP pyrophosphatase